MVQDARGLQDDLAFPAFQVSKVPKAEPEVLGIQGPQVSPAVPVEEGIQENQGKPGSLELRAV